MDMLSTAMNIFNGTYTDERGWKHYSATLVELGWLSSGGSAS